MLSSKTVFVVGAGASKEANMPVGWELRDMIAAKLHMRFEPPFNRFIGTGDQKILHALTRAFKDSANPYFDACAVINTGIGLSASIDDFIELHRSDPAVATCGKLAIAAAILEKERRSKLYVDPSNRENTIRRADIENTWYISFLQLVSNRVAKQELQTLFDNASIICFNYDRCIEQFLYYAIADQYAIKREESRSIVGRLPIYRPYGSIGDCFGSVPFGAENMPRVDDIERNLRTYTEQVRDEESLNSMKKAIGEAEVLVFLGCAFHTSNMTLLEPHSYSEKRIFATREGISQEDLQHVTTALNRLRTHRAPHRDTDIYYSMKCSDLFRDHKLGLRAPT